EYLSWSSRDALSLRCVSRQLKEHPLTAMFFLILRLTKIDDFDPDKDYSLLIDKNKDFFFKDKLTREGTEPFKKIREVEKGFHRLLLISSKVNSSCACLIYEMLPYIKWCPTACLHPALERGVCQRVKEKAEAIQKVKNYVDKSTPPFVWT